MKGLRVDRPIARLGVAWLGVRECYLAILPHVRRSGSRILQGRVSNPSERGTGGRAPEVEHFPGIFWPLKKYLAPGGRTISRAMSNPLLSSYSSWCFVFTKHPVQLKTVATCFQNMFFSKRAPKQKGGCLDTPWMRHSEYGIATWNPESGPTQVRD